MKSTLTQKIMRRLMLVCGTIMIILMMAGCSAGSTIDTTLEINKDLSGVRKMNITISNDVFQQYFTGSIEDLNVLIGEACPQEMSWSYSDNGGVKRYDMEIAFSSPEDYKTKVENILGGDSVELAIAAPDSVWASGISVKESFTDQQLLKWMEDVLVDNGFVSKDNAGMIFSNGTVEVVYGDSTYSAGSRISVDRVEYVSINSIDILTKVNELGDYSRIVVFRIPAASMAKKGDEIKAYMNAVVPGTAAGEWSEEEGVTIFTVTSDGLTREGLETFDNALFDSVECKVAEKDVSGAFSPFTFGRHLAEHIDFTSYICNGAVRVRYGVWQGDPYQVYNSPDGIVQSYMGNEWTEYSGYNLYSEGYNYDYSQDFSLLIRKVYMVDELSVETDRTFGGNWKRSFVFTLDRVPAEEEQAAILDTLNARAGIVEEESDADAGSAEKTEETKARVEVSAKVSDDAYTIEITQKGSGQELDRSSAELFGSSSTTFYACDREFWKVKKQEAFEENIYFGDMLENVTEDFRIHYTAKLGLFAKMQYCSDSKAELSGSSLHAEITSNRVSITYAGSRIDVAAIFFWLFMAAGIVSLLVLLVRLGVFKKKEKPAAEAPVKETVGEETPVSETSAKAAETQENAAAASTVPTPKFCEKCGAPREEGAKFCEKCGTKF